MPKEPKQCFVKELAEGEENEESEPEEVEVESGEEDSDEDFNFGEEEGISLGDIMSTYFTTEDNKNIADTVASLKEELHKHNKYMFKVCTLLEKLLTK